jgi:hypothetical protein
MHSNKTFTYPEQKIMIQSWVLRNKPLPIMDYLQTAYTVLNGKHPESELERYIQNTIYKYNLKGE